MDDVQSTVTQASASFKLPTFTILRERVACEALRHIAGTKSALWQPQAGGPTLRTVLFDILQCASDGFLVSAWHEESQGYRERRYSRCPEVQHRRVRPDMPEY